MKQLFGFDREDVRIFGTFTAFVCMVAAILVSISFYAGGPTGIASLNAHGGQGICEWTDGKQALMACPDGHKRLIDLKRRNDTFATVEVGKTYTARQGMILGRFIPAEYYLSPI